MDLTTALGLVAGAAVVVGLILMGGDLRSFVDMHAVIVIFGGSFAATLIRFPLSSILHGVPMGLKYAFTMRRMTQRDLVDEIARLAEIARKAGPLGLEKEEVPDEFLAVGVRYVADGYDAEILRPAPLVPLAAARRKVETERLARASLRRLVTGADPHTVQWSLEG